MSASPFRVIDGGSVVRRRPRQPAHLLKCRRCGGGAMLEIILGMEYADGKTKGGRKQVACAHCYMRGEMIAVAN